MNKLIRAMHVYSRETVLVRRTFLSNLFVLDHKIDRLWLFSQSLQINIS